LTSERKIVISPTTRIEGNGKVAILLDEEGNVADAHFYAAEIRGFEYFLKGMETDRLPFIVSRICGVCSTAHVLASVKAIENACKVEITETAAKLRELLLMGQIISNHSLVFFFLTLPDFWFPQEEDSSKRNIFQIMRENPDIGRKAVALRNFATQILNVIGKREVHIVSVIPGGLIAPLREKERQLILEKAKEACKIAMEAVNLGKELFEKNWAEFKRAGDYATNYMALTRDSAMEFYDGNVKIINSMGEVKAEFPPSQYLNYVEEKRYGWTYAKFAYLKGVDEHDGIIQVGPTPRMNVNDKATTEMANVELKEFKRKFGNPAHTTLLFDYARLIELLYACERAKELLEDESITRENVRVQFSPRRGVGIGVVEAPRGTLAHQYVISEKRNVEELKLIIPTQVNNAAINVNVRDAASNLIQKGVIKPGLLNRIEMIIRAYDPCIKCAARTAGANMVVEILDNRGRLLKTLSS